MRLEDLRSELHGLSDEQLLERVKDIRSNRRNAPARSAAKKREVTINKAIAKMSRDEIIAAIDLLED